MRDIESRLPYGRDIVKGIANERTFFRAIGYNGDVDDSAEDMWVNGGAYTFPASAAGLEVVSSSADDDGSPAGTGANTIKIYYLDTDHDEQTETVTLNGTGVVATVALDILRVNHVEVLTAGSGKAAAGAIDVRHLTNTPIYATIPAGGNNLSQAVWTVPNGKTAYLTRWWASAGHSAVERYAKFTLKATSTRDGSLVAGVFFDKDILVVGTGSYACSRLDMPILLPAETDIKISVISDTSTSNAACAAGFEGWYE